MRPIEAPKRNGDAWLTVSQAAAILGVKPQSVYPMLGDFLIYRRPLKHRRLVSLRSILRLQDATDDPDFWEDARQQSELRLWVASNMP